LICDIYSGFDKVRLINTSCYVQLTTLMYAATYTALAALRFFSQALRFYKASILKAYFVKSSA